MADPDRVQRRERLRPAKGHTPNGPDSIPSYLLVDSLRSGFLTSAAARGASIFKMADQSRHKSMDTLRGYVRDADIFKRHAREGLL